jgi:hypothetical protein
MAQSLASHHREADRESDREVLDRTTFNRPTALYKGLRNGIAATVIRKVNATPAKYHVYRLNENGAYCHDREVGRGTALEIITSIRESDLYVSYERDDAGALWPGQPHGKHPSPSSGGRQ